MQVLQNVNGLHEAAQAVEDAGLRKLSSQAKAHTQEQQTQLKANKAIVQQV